jgi:hypothetical protein
MRPTLWIQNRVVNPLVRALVVRGLGPPTYALLETTGRRSGAPAAGARCERTPGRDLLAHRCSRRTRQYVRNLEADPRVRVKARPARLRDGLRMRWRSGVAHPMPEDDPYQRHRQLGRGRPDHRLDGILLQRLAALEGGRMLTVRIDLDPPA